MNDAFTDRSFLLLFCVAAVLLFAVCFNVPDFSERPYVDHHPDIDVPEGALGASRSSQWPKVRNLFIQHPHHKTCEWVDENGIRCNSKTDLNVHHISSFSDAPELELSFCNLVTLCRRHHFEKGHGGDWRESNPNLMIEIERNKSRTRTPPARQLAL